MNTSRSNFLSILRRPHNLISTLLQRMLQVAWACHIHSQKLNQLRKQPMKYHVISTSKSGHGAIFTNGKEAKEYMSNYSDSIYTVFDNIPIKIPSIKPIEEKVGTSVSEVSGSATITIYTDGSALGNPGPGGYGVVLIKDDETIKISQGYKHTTNNRMEMLGVITALETLEDDTTRSIKIYSDSQYTLNSITKGWAKGWRKKGWKKSDGKPALNIDLWKRMLDGVEKFPKLTFHWVKGHAGDPMNELADELANGAAHGDDLLEDAGYNR